MSTPTNDGGPVFPQDIVIRHPNGESAVLRHIGMTLREYFANDCPLTPADFAPVYGMPLAEILRDTDHAKAFWVFYAEKRFAYADAMLAEREKGG